MKKRFFVFFVCLLVISFSSQAFAAVISYELTDLGSGSFQYTYTMENNTLNEPLKLFTVWFDESRYSNLVITSPTSINSRWDQIILQSSGFGVPLGYDASALSDGIAAGQTETGFAVKFDWLGMDLPGPQYYEVFDPVSFDVLEQGYTIPEPATVMLITLGSTLLLRKKKNS